MNQTLLQRILLTLTLLFGAMSVASATDRFYIDAVNVEPGETKTLVFILDNDQAFYGFQADISLPEGLEIVTNNGKPVVTLSSRADASYTLVSNLLANGNIRLGSFSTNHTALSRNTGALFYVKVKADSDFKGGTLSMTDVLFIGANDRDVELPDYSIQLGSVHNNKFYIPNFKIAVGETKKIGIVLDNETGFTAFQTDIYLPEGLTIIANSFKLSDRVANNHTISAKSFSDGRTRVACFATDNMAFSGNSGTLLEFEISAGKNVAESCTIELKNQLFSTNSGREYVLPNSSTAVTTQRALVTSILLNYQSYNLTVEESLQLFANIQPSFASIKDVEWKSSNSAIASVSSNGLVSALAPGEVVITCSALDGSGVTATCDIKVNGIPVNNITLSKSSASLKVTEKIALSAIVSPANATDKSIVWISSNPEIACVDEAGVVTAIVVGNATVSSTSTSNPEVKGTCSITVIPTPVSSITITPTSVKLQVGESVNVSAEVNPLTATKKEVTWTSDNSSIASVDKNGKITALSLGSTQIKASANDGSGVTSICQVSVVPTPAESIVINTPSRTQFNVGETIVLTVTVLPANTTNKNVSWSSSNPEIVEISAEGIAMAKKEGRVVITAHDSGNHSADITLTVIPTIAESITLNRTTAAMKVTGTMQLSAVISPETTTNKSVVWVSSNPAIASVSNNGLVTANALGDCRITATVADRSGVSAYCDVTVGATAAESISIEPKGPFTFKVGESVQLSALVLPATTTDKSVQWHSQTDAVRVDKNGLVTAQALGTSRVSATNSAGHAAYVDFTVVPTPVSAITLNSTSVQLKATEVYKLEAVITPANATDKSLTWTSSNKAVATVDANGNITAVAVGVAEIKASANDASGVSATCTVTVVPTLVENVSITASGSTTLKAGQTVQLNATVLPETATDKSVVWTSSNRDIATVSESGLVTAIAVGNVTITATAGDRSSSVNISVEKTLVESIEIQGQAKSIHVGESMVLIATIFPATATDKSVEWTLSETGIVSIRENAKLSVTIEALLPGTVNVFATSQDGVTGCYTINVIPNLAASISLDKSISKLSVGETVQIKATVLPDNTTNKHVVWTSNNSDIATVNESGLVKAVKAGICEVLATTTDGSDLSAVCVINVIQPVTNISLSEHALILHPQDTFKFVATIEPIDATDKSVQWGSSNPSIAEVDEVGIVSANQNNLEGETVITVKTLDGTNLSDECNVKVEKNNSGIQTITMDGIDIIVNGNKVIISKLTNGLVAYLYALNGACLNSAVGSGSDIIFNISSSTCYILHIGNFSLKIVSK